VLKVEDLSVSYGPIRALHGVSLRVNGGEIVAVLGQNGAGKSTLLRSLAGLVSAQRGRVTLADEVLSGRSAVERVRRGVVLCPEGRQLFASLTVGENVRLGATRRRVSWRRLSSEVDHLVQLFPVVESRWRQKAGTLSGGEQQMVALARSLIAAPRLLLLDEPTLGLAPLAAKSVMETLPLIAESGVAVLLVEQNQRAATSVSHRGYALQAGKISAQDDACSLNTPFPAENYRRGPNGEPTSTIHRYAVARNPR